jgi:hypothetical protein
MPTIFPPEIIHDSTASLFVRRKARYAVVYTVVGTDKIAILENGNPVEEGAYSFRFIQYLFCMK